MSLLECLIERDGPTTINDGGFKFVFEENEAGHKVCDVLAEGAATRLLNFTWFRKYRPDVDYKEPEEIIADDGGDSGSDESDSGDQEESNPDVSNENVAEQQNQDSVKTEKELIDERIVLLKQTNPDMSYRAIGQAVGRSQTYVSKIIKGK